MVLKLALLENMHLDLVDHLHLVVLKAPLGNLG